MSIGDVLAGFGKHASRAFAGARQASEEHAVEPYLTNFAGANSSSVTIGEYYYDKCMYILWRRRTVLKPPSRPKQQ